MPPSNRASRIRLCWAENLSGGAGPLQGQAFVTVDTIGSGYDTMPAVYAGTALSTLTEIASDDDSGVNYTSLVTFPTKSNATYQVAVDGYDGDAGDINLRVRFGAASYALTVVAHPTGSGTVSVNPPPDQGGEYTPGEIVTLTALPAAGYAFSNWSGHASAANNPLALVMNSDRTVTAGFLSSPLKLTAFQPQTPESIRTNGFRFLLFGQSNTFYALERSTDFTNWISFRTNQVTSSQPVEIQDATAGNAPARFYRARRMP